MPKPPDGQPTHDGGQMTPQKFAQDCLQKSVARMEEYGKVAAELGPHFTPGCLLDQVIETEREIMAGFAAYAGEDPAMAQELADLARIGGSKTIH